MRTGVRRVAKKILAPLISIPLLKRGMKKFDTQVTVADQVDFERSKAFALGHSIPFGAIYLNVEGREPHGFIEEKTRYREVKDEITRKLVAVDQEVDTRLETTIFDPKRIYEGNMLDLAPDILFTMNDWKCVIVKSFTDHVYEDKPYSNRHTGSHRMDGIFLAYGPDIKVGRKITNARIYDVAPTILHLFNRKIPATMDGKVLMSIFNENSSCAKRKPKYVAADPAVEDLRKKIRKLKRTKRI
jgi:predicted AlkP superfamily phosphohydrolase/phosphomutase